jgi:hypothetical protein
MALADNLVLDEVTEDIIISEVLPQLEDKKNPVQLSEGLAARLKIYHERSSMHMMRLATARAVGYEEKIQEGSEDKSLAELSDFLRNKGIEFTSYELHRGVLEVKYGGQEE